MDLSAVSRSTAGVLFLAIPLIEFGGTYMLRLVRGKVEATPFQQSFARAGHAHAGVLVILGLVVQVMADATRLDGLALSLAHSAIPLAAILMPAGFFFSSAGAGRTKPSPFIWLVYAGAVSLAVGSVVLGYGLLTA